MSASVAFVTHARLGDQGSRVHSNVGSLRRQLILPAETLRDRGIRTRIVSLDTWPREQVGRILREADKIVFSKLFATPGESGKYARGAAQYLEALELIPDAAQRSLFVMDDAARSADFYSELARRGIPRLASSDCLEPCEGPPGTPRVPSRSLAQRLGARLARRAGVGLDPWRLQLLWFDDAPSAGSLAESLPQLRALASEVPIGLECIAPADADADGLAAAVSDAFAIRLSPWSLGSVADALSRADLVLLTTADRSANRLLESVNAGRVAVGPLLPVFESYAAYARLGNGLGDAIRWVIAHAATALEALKAGQAYVRAHHSQEAVARFWLRQLRLDG